MPLGIKPECTKCGTRETPLWHATDVGNLCNGCLEKDRARAAIATGTEAPSGTTNNNNNKEEEQQESKPARKSTRITRFNGKTIPGKPGQQLLLKNVPKGKGRRHIFKKTVPKFSYFILSFISLISLMNFSCLIFFVFLLLHTFQPMKSPVATATPVTSSFVFYKGSYFQIGDIVSMQDIDGGIYYAQIRGLLTDQYCEKSAAVTWLLPTTAR